MKDDTWMFCPRDLQHALVDINTLNRKGVAQVTDVGARTAGYVKEGVPRRLLVSGDKPLQPRGLGLIILPRVDCVVKTF
jgi:hypothetical protein